jgi:uncharacterized protein YndB with AHSA1/START domain
MADEFRISHVFKAPRRKVWNAWTQPEKLVRWFGPKGTTTTVITADIRPGGFVHCHMLHPGGATLWGKFVYREIVPPSRLVYEHSFADEHANITGSPFGGDWPKVLLTTVTFEDAGGGTRVTVTWVPFEATPAEEAEFRAAMDSMTGGWSGSFEVLEEYLATSG